jgi:hypothetical protein
LSQRYYIAFFVIQFAGGPLNITNAVFAFLAMNSYKCFKNN